VSGPVKVGLISLGCAKNLVDSEVMLGALTRDGMALTTELRDADVVIVNTCGFIEPAKQESIDAILKANELRRTGRCRALIMAGCLPQRYPRELQAELPEVDAFVGLNEVPRIAEIVRGIVERASRPFSEHAPNGRDARSTNLLYHSGPAKYVLDASAPRLRLTPAHYAYVKIAEGCNHPCTFCSIPRIRGGHRSRPLRDVLAEVRMLVRDGVKEINLISQDTTWYGRDIGASLPVLLREIEKLGGDFWVRLLYTHPAHWSDELIAIIAACGKVCRYVDIPLQHINDTMLAAMRRETDGQFIRDLLFRICSGIPGVAVRTAFIVGFPGETEKQFAELVEFIREAKVTRLGVFAYSQEDGTPAAKLPRQVPARVRQQRRGTAMAAQQAVSRELLRGMIGRTLRVLMDQEGEGRSYLDAPGIDGKVFVRGKAKAGEFVNVRITGATEYDLKGEVTT
jgi:ribosomal protein S12 methylthiotransferase